MASLLKFGVQVFNLDHIRQIWLIWTYNDSDAVKINWANGREEFITNPQEVKALRRYFGTHSVDITAWMKDGKTLDDENEESNAIEDNLDNF